MSKSSTRTDSARSSLALLAQVAGLLGTGWLVWSASLVPRLDRQPLAFVIAEALEYALMAWAWSAAITFLLFLMVPKSNRSEAAAIALRTASTAVWFGPATILLSMFSPATLAAALILVVNATRLLSVHWRPIYSQRNLRRPFLHSLGVSACIEAGAVFLLMDYPLAGAALFVLSAALLTLLAIVTGATEIQRTDKLPRSVLGALLTVILAAGLTVGGLTGTVKHRTRWDHASEPRPGILQSARELLHALLYGEPAPDSASPDDRLAKKLTRPERDSSEISDDSFPGVVLWPEVKPNTILVAPLPVMRRAALGLPAADPLSIRRVLDVQAAHGASTAQLVLPQSQPGGPVVPHHGPSGTDDGSAPQAGPAHRSAMLRRDPDCDRQCRLLPGNGFAGTGFERQRAPGAVEPGTGAGDLSSRIFGDPHVHHTSARRARIVRRIHRALPPGRAADRQERQNRAGSLRPDAQGRLKISGARQVAVFPSRARSAPRAQRAAEKLKSLHWRHARPGVHQPARRLP